MDSFSTFSCLSYQLQCKIDEYSMSPVLLKNLYYASLSCHEAFRKSHQLTIHVEYIVNLCYRYLRKNNNCIRHILQLLAPITHHEQECVFVWLNAGCVLHLQVADSIPAQVSGSQSVFCMCAVVVPHPPPLLCSLICPLFLSPLRATSSIPFLETSAWIGQPSPPLPPCSSLLFPFSFWLPVQPYFLGSLKSLITCSRFHFHLYLRPCFLPPSLP